MKLVDCEQGTPEWKAARAGSLGASCIHEVVAKTKAGWAASRANRMASMLVERLTGQPQDGFQTAAMLYGIEMEPEARAAYSFFSDCDVSQLGMVLHPELDGTHASPDGLVGSAGLVEIKCPQPAQHLSTLLGEPVQDKYVKQMLWQMRCCERDWCDFVSYNPSFPEPMRLFVKRFERDDVAIAELEKQVAEFLAELNEKQCKLLALYAEREAA